MIHQSIVLIARASHVSATNAWIHNNLDTAGRDNLTVPLIGITDADTAAPTHYGCNFASVPAGSDDAFRKGVVNSPYVSLFVDVPFDKAAASMNLRVKPSPSLI